MLAKLTTYALVGIDALPVEVEVDTAHGLPKTILVGLPDTAVKESVHRIERALANLGYQRPSGRTIINLAPARSSQGRRRVRFADCARHAGRHGATVAGACARLGDDGGARS